MNKHVQVNLGYTRPKRTITCVNTFPTAKIVEEFDSLILAFLGIELMNS